MLTTYKLLFIIAGIGILNTIYLSYHVFSKTPVSCWFFPKKWCEKVQFSRYSKTFGVPNPILGLIMLLAIAFGFFLALEIIIPFWYVYVVICGGFLFSVYFMYIQAYVLKAFCTWCVLSFIVFMALFIVATKIIMYYI